VREGVLKVSFSETPVVHWYVSEPGEKKEWERPVSAFRPEVVRRRVKELLQEVRKSNSSVHQGHSQVPDDPNFILEEVGTDSAVPVVSFCRIDRK
jgi:hypothetical protein